MLENLGGWEIVALLLVALFVIGPERLPKILGEIGKMLRKVKTMAANAQADISREVGTDIDITDLNPKTFLRKHVLSEADEEALKSPLKSAFGDLKSEADAVRRDLEDTTSAIKSTRAGRANRREDSDTAGTEDSSGDGVETTPAPQRTVDLDAT
ncbi:MAG TPA: twin-arginine translocase TatA/TatE family subunit [Candidatus Stackebrandtia excrementipullorum]|nr:twin-arginine translocase TatA/TatE family subunit [Candidatus Stackebrandtia excrementipullorum]